MGNRLIVTGFGDTNKAQRPWYTKRDQFVVEQLKNFLDRCRRIRRTLQVTNDFLRKLFVNKQKYSLDTTLSSCQNVRSHMKS